MVKIVFTNSLRQASTTLAYAGRMFLREINSPALPFIDDREAALDAARLIEDHGELAGDVAAANAGLFRDRGNAVSFCRWRQIERLIGIMTEVDGEQTRH